MRGNDGWPLRVILVCDRTHQSHRDLWCISVETRVRLLSPEHRGKYNLLVQANHWAEAKSEKRKFKKGRSCAWMQDIKSSKSIGDWLLRCSIGTKLGNAASGLMF